MLHALEILPHQRRKGMGVWMMRQAAYWAAEQGATELAVLCTRANAGANALYARLGMQQSGGYHYRIKR
jgi:GNAT superfamily N-acetyltransferase